MKNKINILLILSFVITCSFRSYSQATCASPGTICPQPAYAFAATSGTGLPAGLTISNPVTNPQGVNNGCMLTNAPNPEWLIINITSSGNLAFSFGPCGSTNPQNGYLHWIMWPYTSTTCNDITANTLAPVACNYNCATTGGTGMGTPPACASACNYQPSIPVLAGEQYLILVSNVSGLPGPITFPDPGPGSPGISCSPPTIANVTACPCQTVVTPINWAGVTGTSFTITSPTSGGVGLTQTSPNFTVSNCSTAATTVVYTVQATGTDAYGQPANATLNFSLVINPTVAVTVAYDTNYCYGSCANFTINPPGKYSISSPIGVYPTSTINPQVICGLYGGTGGIWNFIDTANTGCVGTTTLQVNVSPNFFITVTPTINVCQGAIANLISNMPTAPGYTWTAPDGHTIVAIGATTPLPPAQPSIAGVYTVVAYGVFNTIKCWQTATTQVNVVQTHSITTQASYTYCQGVPVSLSASTDPAATGIDWTGPNGWAGPLGQLNPVVSNSILCSQAGNYVITAYFSNGQLSCPVTGTSNIQVVCFSPPAVITSPSIACQYSTISVQGVPIGPWTTMTLTGPNGFSSNTPTNMINNVQLAATGIYICDVIYAIGTQTCASQGQGQLTVLGVNPVIIDTVPPVCYPQQVNLSANSQAASSYSWSGPNGFNSTQRNPTLFYPPLTATGIYTVFTTYNYGVISCANSNTVYVSVNPVPSFTLPQYLHGCHDDTLSLNGPSGAFTYSWSSSTGAINSSQQKIDLSPLTPAKSGTYYLKATLGFCSSTESTLLDVIGPITLTLTPQSRTTCPTVSYFETEASGGSQNYSVVWNPAFGLSSPVGPIVTATLNATTVYNVMVRDIACPEPPSLYSFSVIVNQPPVPDLQLTDTKGCEPYSVLLNTRTGTLSSLVTYDFGGSNKFQGDNITMNLPVAGTYTLNVTLEGPDGCTRQYQYPDAFVVYPKALSDIQWSPEIPTSTENVVTFNAVPRTGVVVDHYKWSFSGTGAEGYDSSDVKNPVRKYENTGVFPVMLITTTNNQCKDTTIKFLTIRDEFNVFIPNSFTPNNDGLNDLFQVKGLGFKVEAFSLQVFDRWGHNIYTTTDPTKGWDGTVKGQTPQEGVYIYRVDVIGSNGEGKKEYMGHVTLLK